MKTLHVMNLDIFQFIMVFGEALDIHVKKLSLSVKEHLFPIFELKLSSK